jgi:hypothetical protein
MSSDKINLIADQVVLGLAPILTQPLELVNVTTQSIEAKTQSIDAKVTALQTMFVSLTERIDALSALIETHPDRVAGASRRGAAKAPAAAAPQAAAAVQAGGTVQVTAAVQQATAAVQAAAAVQQAAAAAHAVQQAAVQAAAPVVDGAIPRVEAAAKSKTADKFLQNAFAHDALRDALFSADEVKTAMAALATAPPPKTPLTPGTPQYWSACGSALWSASDEKARDVFRQMLKQYRERTAVIAPPLQLEDGSGAGDL